MHHGFAFCLPEAPASKIKGKITRQPALGIQLRLGHGKARYSSRLKCSQMTTKSSIPHHVTRCKEQLVLSQTSSLPILSLSSREHSPAPLQKHRPVLLPQPLRSSKSTAHKHTNLPPKPRLSLTSRRRDVSNPFVPVPQLQATRAKAKQLASPSRFTCSQLVSRNEPTRPASSYILGKGKKKRSCI